MKLNRRLFHRFAALLTLLLILAYISVAFFPHVHPHGDADCALCVILQSSRELLSTPVLCAVLALAITTLAFARARERIAAMRDTTPVGLKVKLSD